HLERAGATYKANSVERFATGNPMNVTDLAVGPDGAIYFTMGGRGSQGGVYRIVYGNGEKAGDLQPQPLAAWSRANKQRELDQLKRLEPGAEPILAVANDSQKSALIRMRAANSLQAFGPRPDDATLIKWTKDKDPEFRAYAVWLLGV